jgi:hypothetical protein
VSLSGEKGYTARHNGVWHGQIQTERGPEASRRKREVRQGRNDCRKFDWSILNPFRSPPEVHFYGGLGSPPLAVASFQGPEWNLKRVTASRTNIIYSSSPLSERVSSTPFSP